MPINRYSAPMTAANGWLDKDECHGVPKIVDKQALSKLRRQTFLTNGPIVHESAPYPPKRIEATARACSIDHHPSSLLDLIPFKSVYPLILASLSTGHRLSRELTFKSFKFFDMVSDVRFRHVKTFFPPVRSIPW